MRYFDEFLKMVKRENCPLDFFSWHSYTSIEETVTFANYARKKLDVAGFTDTEHTCNEWNVEAEKRGTAFHAAQTARMLLALQNISLDSAMFYDARIGVSVYGGLFNPLTREPFPAYYGFKAFNELYKRKKQVAVTCDIPGVYAVGSKGEENNCLVIVNTNPTPEPLSLNIDRARIRGCHLTDDTNVWQETALPETLPANSFVCMILQ